MANQWFRLYSEFANDPKVQMLSEENQRRLIMLFCFRCNSDVTLQDEEVTFQLRITPNEWMSTKAIFIAKGFINDSNEVLNWDKRQYVSDSSAERVARHRAKVKTDIVTPVTSCNVTVTPPEQNRTEQNIKDLCVFALNYLNEKTKRNYRPVKSNIDLVRGRIKEGYTQEDILRVIDAKCSQWMKDEKMSDYLRPATLFNATKFSQYAGEQVQQKIQKDEYL